MNADTILPICPECQTSDFLICFILYSVVSFCMIFTYHGCKFMIFSSIVQIFGEEISVFCVGKRHLPCNIWAGIVETRFGVTTRSLSFCAPFCRRVRPWTSPSVSFVNLFCLENGMDFYVIQHLEGCERAVSANRGAAACRPPLCNCAAEAALSQPWSGRLGRQPATFWRLKAWRLQGLSAALASCL